MQLIQKGELNSEGLPYGEKQVMFLQADITEIHEDTGWSPEIDFKSGLESIIKRR